MEKTDKRYQAYIDILREELIPAMGCTEPIAVAYAAAAARNTLGELPDKVLVEASGSMIKNVKSVIVPNTDNMKGLEAAAAAGIVAGKQEKKLEVIADVTPEQTKAIRAYLDQTDIKVGTLRMASPLTSSSRSGRASIPHRCALRCSTPISSMWKRTARYWWIFRYTEIARRP